MEYTIFIAENPITISYLVSALFYILILVIGSLAITYYLRKMRIKRELGKEIQIHTPLFTMIIGVISILAVIKFIISVMNYAGKI